MAAALLAGCGALRQGQGDVQPPAGAPGAMPQTSSTSSYQVLYRFLGGTDGANPAGGVIDVNGTLYGTTSAVLSFGGGGTVFSLSTSGAKKILYSFGSRRKGRNPESGLTNVHDTLYGTTEDGGSRGFGTVYSIDTSGAEALVYSFTGNPNGKFPATDLLDYKGTLYGTTRTGQPGVGTVYGVSKSGVETVLYHFDNLSDGRQPKAGLIAVNGTLYGTTEYGGKKAKDGTVYSLTTTGYETVLHSFVGSPSDGARPVASLINVDGTLYGTTTVGGANNDGTVYSISRSGAEKVLHSFGGYPSDGATPNAGLIDVNGTLYGETASGGEQTCYRSSTCGTVFSITPAGVEHVVHFFTGGTDGATPKGGLTDVNGTLYGTTVFGGGSGCSNLGCGTVFELTP